MHSSVATERGKANRASASCEKDGLFWTLVEVRDTDTS